MAEETDVGTAAPSPAPPAVSTEEAEPLIANPSPATNPENRADLLVKARTFLHQPQVQREDPASKRRFLAAKGLNGVEIEELMREMPVQLPAVPPRSYPQPPPSNLPLLLLGAARLLSWLVGGVAALALIYRRILLPRIIETSMARNSIKTHQLSLLHRLNASLAELKQSQIELAAVLPKPEPYREPSAFAACSSLDALLKAMDSKKVSQIPAISLLRCAIADFHAGAETKSPSTAELFTVLEGKFPWLESEEGRTYESNIWETLTTCPLFVSTPSPNPASTPGEPSQEILHWSYTPSEPAPPTALAQSLSKLESIIPKPSDVKHSPFQHALQAMTDFTGYISSQMYVPYVPLGTRLGPGMPLGPAEEELRKEIRTLKGLVLNRRTFLPSVRSQ